MSSFNEKAGTFILTAIQAANDVKRIVEERVKAVIKESMVSYDAELSSIRERVDALEKIVLTRARSTVEHAAPPRKAKKAPAKKPDAAPCAIEGCTKASISRGLCKNHYYQFKRGTVVKTDASYALAAKEKPAAEAAPAAEAPEPKPAE